MAENYDATEPEIFLDQRGGVAVYVVVMQGEASWFGFECFFHSFLINPFKDPFKSCAALIEQCPNVVMSLYFDLIPELGK